MRTMFKVISIFFLTFSLFSCGKTHDMAAKHDMSDEYALKEVVKAYYSAKLNNDYETMYKYINPSTKKVVSFSEFVGNQKNWANMKIKDFYVGNVVYSDSNNAMVEVIVVLVNGTFPTSFPFLFEEGKWYRRYPTN